MPWASPRVTLLPHVVSKVLAQETRHHPYFPYDYTKQQVESWVAWVPCFFFFSFTYFKLIFIGIWLLYNDVLVSQFSSVTQLCPALCHPIDCSKQGSLVHSQFPELAETHVHRVGDAIQPSHLLSSLSPPAFNLSQHQGLFQWVSSSHQVAKVLEFQLQH